MISSEPNRIRRDETEPAVVITGASDGIGFALAKRFLGRGHSVVMIARGEARLAAAIQTLGPAVADGRQLVPLALDVTDPEASEIIAAALARSRLHLGVLINNAGLGLAGPFAGHAMDDVARLIDLNIAAVTRLTHWAIADMQAHGTGHIINIASLGAYVPGPYQAAYYASKAYVTSLSEALAEEQKATGIRISVALPGPVDTAFHAGMGAEGALYRRIVPSMSSDAVASSIYRGYRLGLRVIVPGILNRLLALIMRATPHPIIVPLTGFLLATGPRHGDRQR